MKRALVLLFSLGLILSIGCKIKTTIEMTPNIGELCFEVQPASAKVYVDEKYIGKVNEFSPAKGCLELPIGTHRIEIKKSGFESYSEKAYIGSGRQWVKLKMGKAPYKGTVIIKEEPKKDITIKEKPAQPAEKEKPAPKDDTTVKEKKTEPKPDIKAKEKSETQTATKEKSEKDKSDKKDKEKNQ